MDGLVYLDNQSTTPVDPLVLEHMLPFFTTTFGNASSSEHFYGWEAMDAVDKSRSIIAKSIQADKSEILFTSGATEANNMILKGIRSNNGQIPHIITAATEHKCILDTLKKNQTTIASTILPVDSNGRINLDELIAAIQPNTVLVSIMFANNEIGTIHPVKEIGAICRQHNILFHTDAAQAIGKVNINVEDMNIDFLSASAHKIYGPKGVGFLYARKQHTSKIAALLNGGGQERGLRSGTLNTPGIVGLGKAIELAKRQFEEHFWKYLQLRNYLYTQIKMRFPEATLNGCELDNVEYLQQYFSAIEASQKLQRLPNNLSISFKNLPALDLIKQARRVAVSTGSACSSSTVEPSHVLLSIGLPEKAVLSTVRFGVGRFNTKEEIDFVVDQLVNACQNL